MRYLKRQSSRKNHNGYERIIKKGFSAKNNIRGSNLEPDQMLNTPAPSDPLSSSSIPITTHIKASKEQKFEHREARASVSMKRAAHDE